MLLGLSCAIIVATGVWAGFELGTAKAHRPARKSVATTCTEHLGVRALTTPLPFPNGAHLKHSTLTHKQAIAPYAAELERQGLARIEMDHESLLDNPDRAAMLALTEQKAYLYIETPVYSALVYRSPEGKVVHTMAVQEGSGSILIVDAHGSPNLSFFQLPPSESFDIFSELPTPPASTLVFDIPAERGNRYTLFKCDATTASIRAFYATTMVQHGWQYDRQISERSQEKLEGEFMIFRRGQERVLIYARPDGSGSYVSVFFKGCKP